MSACTLCSKCSEMFDGLKVDLDLDRDTLGNCFFLRTEITLKGATYQISFTDTDQLPPPFRIENISEVTHCSVSSMTCYELVDIIIQKEQNFFQNHSPDSQFSLHETSLTVGHALLKDICCVSFSFTCENGP